MNIIERVYWFFTVSIRSLLGFLILKKIGNKSDPKEWNCSFSNKKVLIVGSGPSLDKANEAYFLNFDVIVYINHAVKFASKTEDEYFFSTDVKVVEGIRNKNYYNNILKMGCNKSIIAPFFFQQALCLQKQFRNSFSWIIASNASYKLYRINKPILGIRFPVTAVYRPEQPSIKQLNTWFSQENQVIYFPVMESTSALSAILFVAKYMPKYISLIGCDFSAGRSKSIIKDCPAHTVNVFDEAKGKFIFLKKYLLTKNIKVNNDSWYL